MERQVHSLSTLFDSLVKYAIDHTITIENTDAPQKSVYVLTLYVKPTCLHSLVNICSSTADVLQFGVLYSRSSDKITFSVKYVIELPF